MAVKNVVAKSWSIIPSYDGRKWSAWPAGDKPENFDTDAVQDAMYAAFYASLTPTHTYYLDPLGGSNSNPGTLAQPFLTAAYAESQMVASDVLVVLDGNYTVGVSGFFNSPLLGVDFPSGSSWANPTVIRAQTRFGVRLTQATANFNGEVINPGSSTNLMFDGFIIDTSATGVENPVVLKDDNGLYRTLIRKTNCDDFGGWVNYHSNCNIEDVHAFGCARYGFRTGVSTDTNMSNSTLRRCVGYMAVTGTEQPKATFACYGSNTSTWHGIKEMAWQNCYDIDSPASGTGPSEPRWGSWYFPKSVTDMRLKGCGSLNCGVAYAAFRTDNIVSPDDTLGQTLTDCFVYGLTGDPATTPASFGGSSGKYFNHAFNCTAQDTAQAEFSDNFTGRNTNPLVGGFTYPVIRVGGNGAEQLYQVGTFRTRLNGVGSETLTSRRLWPFPYQSYVAALFGETITKPVGYWPTAISQSTNPFATLSITERIWRATGAAMPDLEDFY